MKISRLLQEKRENAFPEALIKPLKYANESPLLNVDVDMVINESTPLLLLHKEIEESELSTLHKQISNYHSELKKWKLRSKVQSLGKRVKIALFSFKNIKFENLMFYYGVVNTFKQISVLVKPYLKRYRLKLTCKNHLLLVSRKIRLGLLNKDIAIRFNIHNTTASKIFKNWVENLSNVLRSL